MQFLINILINFLLKTSKQEYLKRFDAASDGPLHQQPWVKKDIENFDKQI